MAGEYFPSSDELLRNQQQPGFARLGAGIGDALFGGGARDLRSQMIVAQGERAGAQMERAMAQARTARDQEVARRGLADRAYAKGDSELGDLFTAGYQPNQIAEYRLHTNQLGALQGATKALQGVGYTPEMAALGSTFLNGDNGANPQSAVEAMARAGIPFVGSAAVPQTQAQLGRVVKPDSTRIGDGMVYDETAPSTQNVAVTPVGQALIGERNAIASAARARADKAASTGSGEAGFGGDIGNLLGAFAEQGIALPAGFRSKEQMRATLQSLLDRNPGVSVEDIAKKVGSGQIGFSGEKKATSVAAGQAGKVDVAGNEMEEFDPLVRQALAAIPRSSFMPLNRLMQTADEQISDPNLARAKAVVNSYLNAYDQLTGRGGTDVEKRAHNRALLTTAQGPEAALAALDMMQTESKAAARAADRAIHKYSGGGPAPAPSGIGDALTAKSPHGRVVRTGTKGDGTRVAQYEDGTIAPVQ